MASVETGAPRSHSKGKKKKKRRVGVRVDMTPMVDVAMLLLTFFMLTTVFSRPQTMELNLPPDSDTKVEVAMSNLLTLIVNPDGKVYWNKGTDQMAIMPFVELRKFMLEQSRANPKLITVVKVDRDGKYLSLVDVLDEFNLANVTRFSLAPVNDADKKNMAKAKS
jgi:biopolymer transport protein ExbD